MVATDIVKIDKEIPLTAVAAYAGNSDATVKARSSYLGVLQLHIDPNVADRLKLGEEPNDVHVLRRFYCEGNNLDIKYSVYVTRTPDDHSSLVPLGTGEIRQILM